MKTTSTLSTTIRITKDTKNKIENLDFVRKDTFDQILLKLIKFYEKNKKRCKKWVFKKNFCLLFTRV